MICCSYHTVKFTLEYLLKYIMQTNKKSRINQPKFTKAEFFTISKKLFDYQHTSVVSAM